MTFLQALYECFVLKKKIFIFKLIASCVYNNLQVDVTQKHLVPQNHRFYLCIAMFLNVMIFKQTLVFIIWLMIGL